MKRFIAIAIALAAASSASAQTTSLGLTRTLLGCNGSLSCHFMTIDMAPDPSQQWLIGTVHVQNRFFALAGVPVFYLFDPAIGQYNGGPFDSTAPAIYQSSWHDTYYQVRAPASWRPTTSSVFVSYGRPGALYPSDEQGFAAVRMTVTPEPATALLMLTGIAGIGAAARRRRTKPRA